MPIPKRQRSTLHRTRQPRSRFAVNFFTVEQHRLTIPGLQQVRARIGRLGDRRSRNQSAVHGYGQFAVIGIERRGVKDRRGAGKN